MPQIRRQPVCYNDSVTSTRLLFRVHAIQRMFERRITEENVKRVLQAGEVIEDYSDEMPNAGGVMLGKRGRRPLHVVMSENSRENEVVIITVYEPDPAQWNSDFKTRKR